MKNRIKTSITIILLMTSFVLLAQKERIKVDGVTAVVGDQIVLDSEIGQLKIQLKQQGVDIKKMNDCQILEQLLQEKMLIVEAKKDTLISVSDKEVESMVDQQIEYMKTQMGGSIDKVLEFYNKKTRSELVSELKELDKNRKLSARMKEKVIADVDVNPEEVKTFFDAIPKDKIPELNTQVSVYQLVVKPKPDQSEIDKVIKKLKDIKKKVEEGSSFRVQAVLNSQDPGSRANGGKYVLNRKSAFVQEFKDVAFSLEEGQVSEPFKTEFGYHILYVEQINGQERVVRHILMIPEVGFLNNRAAEKQIDTIRKRIVNKEITFEEAAKEFSDDKETKDLGGKIVNPNTGEFMLDLTTLDPKLHQRIQDLKEGEITPVFSEKDRTGKTLYKILYIKKRVPTHKLDFVKDFPKVKKMALAEKKEKVLSKWINEKIKNNYIKINNEFLKCNFDSNWKKK
jgi:peptidyl-prolyl cis-trans isomerase SurA